MDKIRLFDDDGMYTPAGIDISVAFGVYLTNAEYFLEDYDVREMAHLLILEVMGIELGYILDRTCSSEAQEEASEEDSDI